MAIILDAAPGMLNAETHLGFLLIDTNPVQQLYKIRIGPVVEHNETGIDCILFAIHRNIDGSGMPKKAVG